MREHFRAQYLSDLAAVFGASFRRLPGMRRTTRPTTTTDGTATPLTMRAGQISSAVIKKINGPDGNSPVSNDNSQFSNAATNYPESEDLNRDNTMNETEEYFQYRVNAEAGYAGGQQLRAWTAS